jgi:hypothetical protein
MHSVRLQLLPGHPIGECLHSLPYAQLCLTTSSGDAATHVVTSDSFTLRNGSTSASACVLRTNQMMLEDDAISAALDDAPGWVNRASAGTAQACISACNSATLCFAEFTYTSPSLGTCRILMLAPVPAGAASGLQLYVKLLPAAQLSALSKQEKVEQTMDNTAAKTMASGMYAAANISAWGYLMSNIGSLQLGVDLSGSAAGWLARTVMQCQDTCDR